MKRNPRKIALLAGLLSMLPAIGWADSLKLTWNFPIARMNGMPLAVDDLAYSTLIWVCNNKEGSRNIPIPQNWSVVNVPAPGECIYYVTVTDLAGLNSGRSTGFEWIAPASPPNTPTDLWGELIE